MGLLDGLFEKIDNRPAARDLTPNVANKVADHLRAKWPELAGIPGLWFSGSQVHSIVRGVEPPAESDTDIFCLKNAPKVFTTEAVAWGVATIERSIEQEVMVRLKVDAVGTSTATPRPPKNPMYNSNGVDITTPKGAVDFWTSEADTVAGQLRMYPRSHSHCRAAFSFTEGLIVLPNEEAPKHGEVF